MSINSTFAYGAHNLFWSDPVEEFRPITTHDTVRSSHLSYWIAISCLLLSAYLFRPTRRKGMDVPFYKASKLKWMFDAESLVRDSYSKVDSLDLLPRR
jgi:hypothetical protein